MIPSRYDNSKMFSPLHGEFDRLMRLWQDSESSGATAEWMPNTDVVERAEHFELYVDLPGVAVKDIDITLQNDTLTISGSRSTDVASSDGDVSRRRVERGQGHFCRQFVLPNSIDNDGIEASSELGVIKITVPKKAHARPRRIPVSVAA